MNVSVRLVSVLALGGLVALGACDKKEKKGLPAATDWQSPALGSAPPPAVGPSAGRPAPSADPHAGVPGAPPLGGGAGDPHAGVPGAPPLTDEQMAAGARPHGDLTGGGMADPAMQLPPPDQNRPIDPSRFLAGTVTVPAANQGKIPGGAAIFLTVRPAGGGGMPLAVDKLVATGTWPLSFRITEAQAMTAGTALAGPVVISARFDQDGEARSKQPGDISGQVNATVPADGLVIDLDTVQP